MVTMYTLTGDFDTILGGESKGLTVTIRTNLPIGVPLTTLDTTPPKIVMDGPIRLPLDGANAFSVSLVATNSTGTNVGDGSLRYIVDWHDKATGKSGSSGQFTLTGNADLATKIGSGTVVLPVLASEYVRKDTVTTKGDLPVATAAGVVGRLPVGANGQTLAADSSQTMGIRWINAPTLAGTNDYAAQQRISMASGDWLTLIRTGLATDLGRWAAWVASTGDFFVSKRTDDGSDAGPALRIYRDGTGLRSDINGLRLGDTGWRAITTWDASGAVTGEPLSSSWAPTSGQAGGIYVKRATDAVKLNITGLTRLNGTTQTLWADGAYRLPAGYRPTRSALSAIPVAASGVTTGLLLSSSGLCGRGSFESAGANGPIYNAEIVGDASGTAWPTIHPGTPA